MEEANKKCESIKDIYEGCYRNWYKDKFMKGVIEAGCQDEFEEYKDCVRLAMNQHKQINQRNDTKVV